MVEGEKNTADIGRPVKEYALTDQFLKKSISSGKNLRRRDFSKKRKSLNSIKNG
jgi:hypothetical protein